MYALRERRVHVTQEDFELAVAKVSWDLGVFYSLCGFFYRKISNNMYTLLLIVKLLVTLNNECDSSDHPVSIVVFVVVVGVNFFVFFDVFSQTLHGFALNFL